MTRHYKVFTDFINYISIDETELEKALNAFKKGAGAIFKEGATKRIEVILPDDVKMMGWNAGYKPMPEEQGEISHDGKCKSARRLMADMKEHLALNTGQPFQERLESPNRTHTQGLKSIGDIISKDKPFNHPDLRCLRCDKQIADCKCPPLENPPIA